MTSSDFDTEPFDFIGSSKYALNRLSEELPSFFTYHSLWHTKIEVYRQANLLASIYHLDNHRRHLLLTAVLYHDIGFIISRYEHERISSQIVSATLPNFGFQPDDISLIQGMIMATRLPQNPGNLLEEIIADADLDVLGRTDYLFRNRKLRNELATEGHIYPDEKWYRNQLFFVQNHRYFTAAARSLRSQQKKRNVKLLFHLCKSSPTYEPVAPFIDMFSPILQHTPL